MYARNIDGNELTFDFATGLINNNLLIVDRQTSSVWSQLAQQAISGPMKGSKLTPLPALQTTWKFWRSKHPDTGVMTFNGQAGRPYAYRHANPARPRRRSGSSMHDTSALGLGLHVGDQAHYFPFSELDKAKLPLEVSNGDDVLTIHYEKEALTAWAEDAQGRLLASAVLVYQKHWLAFNPQTTIFQAPTKDE